MIFHGVKEEDKDDRVMRHLIEEILGSGLNLDPNRHIEEVCRMVKFGQCVLRQNLRKARWRSSSGQSS